jgi:hypothetical protein
VFVCSTALVFVCSTALVFVCSTALVFVCSTALVFVCSCLFVGRMYCAHVDCACVPMLIALGRQMLYSVPVYTAPVWQMLSSYQVRACALRPCQHFLGDCA